MTAPSCFSRPCAVASRASTCSPVGVTTRVYMNIMDMTQKRAKNSTIDPHDLPAPMGFSFPCSADLDDGIFDLDFEDGDHSKNQSKSSQEDPNSEDHLKPMTLSPDALDLVLMESASPKDPNVDEGTKIVHEAWRLQQKDTESENDTSDTRRWQAKVSPFYDASLSAITLQDSEVSNGSYIGSTSNKRGCPAVVPDVATARHWDHGRDDQYLDTRLSRTHHLIISPGSVPKSSAPLDRPSTSGGYRPAQGGSDSRRCMRRPLLERLPVDAKTASRWARERHGIYEAVASSVKKEKRALVGLGHTAVGADTNGCTTVGSKLTISLTDRHVSFAVGSEDHSDEGGDNSDAATDFEEEDLLARASELHSSVAGQLRSVNELLKRKSYFYIDTSWSARKLPCPPIAWKGRRVRTSSGADPGAGIASNAGGVAPSAVRRRPCVASNISVDVRLEGRWVSAAKRQRVGVCSIPGEKAHDPAWSCQDAGMAIAPFNRQDSHALFAVFDGHGTNGRQAARECMDRLPKYLVSASYAADPAFAFRRACQWLQRDLAVGSGSGDVYANSGTTLCAALLVGYRLTIANVGDSGCLRISRLLKPASGSQTTSSSSSGDGVCDATVPDRRVAGRGTVETGGETGGASERRLVVQQLSRDHKPEREGELERIRAAGGKVVPLPNRGLGGGGGRGPGRRARAQCTALRPEQARAYRDEAVARDFREEVQRVWRADGHGPGLAMSRSLGDKIAHTVGVTHEPEITEVELNPLVDVMLVIASDGVWDVLSSEAIRKAAETHVMDPRWSARALSEKVCRSAAAAWALAATGGSDDITCVVIKTYGIGISRPDFAHHDRSTRAMAAEAGRTTCSRG